uniref:Uncharacterized protein n=1 Tax=Onchocerca volvulus TaxID=6282 RepID=A0A8R1TUN3_ONCVO
MTSGQNFRERDWKETRPYGVELFQIIQSTNQLADFEEIGSEFGFAHLTYLCASGSVEQWELENNNKDCKFRCKSPALLNPIYQFIIDVHFYKSRTVMYRTIEAVRNVGDFNNEKYSPLYYFFSSPLIIQIASETIVLLICKQISSNPMLKEDVVWVIIKCQKCIEFGQTINTIIAVFYKMNSGTLIREFTIQGFCLNLHCLHQLFLSWLLGVFGHVDCDK